MGEAVLTVKSADSGIKGITSLIDQAKALAQSALAASKNSVKVTVGTITSAVNITIGGTVYGAVASTATPTSTQFYFSDDAATTASNFAALIKPVQKPQT